MCRPISNMLLDWGLSYDNRYVTTYKDKRFRIVVYRNDLARLSRVHVLNDARCCVVAGFGIETDEPIYVSMRAKRQHNYTYLCLELRMIYQGIPVYKYIYTRSYKNTCNVVKYDKKWSTERLDKINMIDVEGLEPMSNNK